MSGEAAMFTRWLKSAEKDWTPKRVIPRREARCEHCELTWNVNSEWPAEAFSTGPSKKFWRVWRDGLVQHHAFYCSESCYRLNHGRP